MLETRLNEADPLKSWRDAKANAKRGAFEALYPHVFLVWSPAPRDANAKAAPRVEFHTQVGSFATFGRGTLETGVMAVYPLQKAPENPFSDRISIGRANNCDIVLRDPSVSKLHGHFRDVTIESAEFTDTKSANGTKVGGTALKPSVPVIVKRLDYMTLGRVRLQVMSPSDLYDWL